MLFDARRAAAVDIDIRGAGKPVVHINGVYEATDESWHVWTVYKKKGCDTHYLEYHAPSSSWQVKPASVRGTKRCWAYLQADNTPPEESMKSWIVIINGEHFKQDCITVTTHQEQAQNDKLLGNLRRRCSGPIKIKGATGRHAAAINGVYEPSTSDLCGGWPVYYNVSSGLYRQVNDSVPPHDPPKSLLVFSPYAMSWAVTVLCSQAEYSHFLDGVGTSAAAGESKGQGEEGDAVSSPGDANSDEQSERDKEGACSPSSVLDTAVNVSLAR